MKTHKTNNLFPSELILENVEYFAVTFGSDDGENWWLSTQTSWAGFEDAKGRIELRKIRLVYPSKMAAIWKKLKQPFYVINNDKDFFRWILGGGNALITKEQICKHLPWEMEAKPCVVEGKYGFTDASELPPEAFQKAPTKKVRMRVLKRDEYRCMICGQRPADDVNIQLHAHHIRPFSERV